MVLNCGSSAADEALICYVIEPFPTPHSMIWCWALPLRYFTWEHDTDVFYSQSGSSVTTRPSAAPLMSIINSHKWGHCPASPDAPNDLFWAVRLSGRSISMPRWLHHRSGSREVLSLLGFVSLISTRRRNIWIICTWATSHWGTSKPGTDCF